ncbi:hypothetical protein GJAV_G00075290, partial [Gymnothorax javanicus]
LRTTALSDYIENVQSWSFQSICRTTTSAGSTTAATTITSTSKITSNVTSSGTASPTTPALLMTGREKLNATSVNNISATSGIPTENSTTVQLTITPNASSTTFKNTSASVHPIIISTTASFSNESGLTSAHVNTNSTLGGHHGQHLARSPGWVAVVCISAIVLALLLVVAIAKCISSRKSSFQKLDDVQLDKMNEDSPFARYPPKGSKFTGPLDRLVREKKSFFGSMSFLAAERRRDSVDSCLLDPSYAVRRRFSGSIHLPPLSRRHSIQDARKLLDLEAFSRLALPRLSAKSLDKITDAQSEAST